MISKKRLCHPPGGTWRAIDGAPALLPSLRLQTSLQWIYGLPGHGVPRRRRNVPNWEKVETEAGVQWTGCGYDSLPIDQRLSIHGLSMAQARLRLIRYLGPAYGRLPTPPLPGVALGDAGDA